LNTLRIENPFDNTILAEIGMDNEHTIQTKLEKLKSGFKAWKQIAIKERINVIRNFRENVTQRTDELSVLLSKEIGKPLSESKKEIEDALKRVEFFIDTSERWLEKEILTENKSLQEFMTYEPLGITCVISAWNYPYIVGFNIFIASLIAGNCVIYKPSEFSTLTGMEITKLLYESGVPENAFQTVIGDGKVGELLLNFPFDGLFFTGAYHTGLQIVKKIAPRLVFTQLELSGKDPLYITDEIDNIEIIAQLALEGTFYNNGQSCCAIKRIYVNKTIYDPFIQSFSNKVKALVMGNPLLPGTNIGPLTRKGQADLLDDQIADAKDKSAIILTGGKRANGKGNFYLPTILTEVNHDMRIMREENFGPVVGVMKVKNDEEAISLMKDSEFGLTASVFCNNESRASNILSQMETGTVYLNCCDRVSNVSPWSGRKHSGFAPNHSSLTIRSFVQTKAYYILKGLKN
jgi:acyl-CoA reductase-like NAD-dependent aldehyde dehydrogenase